MLYNLLFFNIHKLLGIRWTIIDRVKSFVKDSMSSRFLFSSSSIFKYDVLSVAENLRKLSLVVLVYFLQDLSNDWVLVNVSFLFEKFWVMGSLLNTKICFLHFGEVDFSFGEASVI